MVELMGHWSEIGKGEMGKELINVKDAASLAREITDGKGYIVLPELLSSAQAVAARSRVLELAEKTRTSQNSCREENRERVYGLIYKGDVFELMVRHPKVIEVIETILGEEMTLGGFSAHILYPGATRMGVHVDYPYWAMKPPFPPHPVLEIQVIWMVEDFTENNGAPLIVSDSQKLCNQPDISKFEKGSEKVIGKAGSAIVSHGLCWHDTSVNYTNKPRVSILGNYTPKFVRPLEDMLYDLQPDVLDRNPKLKQLIRYELKSPDEPVFKL